MNRIEESILETFKRNPSKLFTTTQLVHEVFSEEYVEINRLIHSSFRKEQRKGYNKKGKLHRKILYHVAKLVAKSILKVEETRGKGEKVLGLAMQEGELVIHEQKHRIVIEKPALLATQIDGYEQEGLIRKFHQESWMAKDNALLIDCTSFSSLEALQNRLRGFFHRVNDVIALHSFEYIFNLASLQEITAFIEYLSLDAHDYHVRVVPLISIKKTTPKESVISFLRLLFDRELMEVIRPMFSITTRMLSSEQKFFTELFALFSHYRRKLHLHNSDIHPPPIFYGRSGSYALTNEEFDYYKNKIIKKSDSCIVGGTSVAVDIGNFFNNKKGATATNFRELMMKIAHTFFEVCERRRRYVTISGLGSDALTKEFFEIEKQYIRLWNYDWGGEEYPLLELLESSLKEIDSFCKMEQIIFKSCGLPIRFSVDISTAFPKFDPDFFTERRYRKTVVSSIRDLQGKEMKAYLRIRERFLKVFNGADRLRFFLSRNTSVEEALRIAKFLFKGYDFPTITLDFRGKIGEMKLTSFLGDL